MDMNMSCMISTQDASLFWVNQIIRLLPCPTPSFVHFHVIHSSPLIIYSWLQLLLLPHLSAYHLTLDRRAIISHLLSYVASTSPSMVPRFLSRCIRLKSCIFNRDAIMSKNPLLLHRNSIQSSCIFRACWFHRSQFFTGRLHGLIHSEKFVFFSL